MDNHHYDLIKALEKKADAVWVYEKYIKDAQNCEQCQELWEKLKEKDQQDISELKKLMKDHFQMNPNQNYQNSSTSKDEEQDYLRTTPA